ncbi:hypothetical protein U9M48_018648 [Paspalum notatum var. saurae]|uniref:WRKY domain-containing protein n=1 Tax=Paspalum notatum var. saurae TaxID=547442 RepID=A0AAQ3TBY1_PASNO
MSSYSSLLSLSHGDLVVGGDDAADDDMAAVCSYLSLDTALEDDVAEEYYCCPSAPEQEEAAAAAFHSMQMGQVTLFDTLQLQADDDGYCVSGRGGEQSMPDASAALSSSPAAALLTSSHHKMNQGSTSSTSSSGGATRLLGTTRGVNGGKIAFKTRSDVDVLDDGYRWRKYGKKLVKNSPNPSSDEYFLSLLKPSGRRAIYAIVIRNYYRCSSEGCHVKKRVERARDDARFVVTTYDGVHNHPAAAPRPRTCRLAGEPPHGGQQRV